jgi:hypothetical protein
MLFCSHIPVNHKKGVIGVPLGAKIVAEGKVLRRDGVALKENEALHQICVYM